MVVGGQLAGTMDARHPFLIGVTTTLLYQLDIND
jgi:hypothetical protein